jgi:hypothetical protein
MKSRDIIEHERHKDKLKNPNVEPDDCFVCDLLYLMRGHIKDIND